MNSLSPSIFLPTYMALEVFNEALEEKIMLKSRVNVDGCIQRFEFSFELFWKLLKHILESQGVTDAAFPKIILVKAYSGKLIGDEQKWLKMLEDRNNTSHTYKQFLAEEIFARLPMYYTVMKKTFDELCEKYNINQEELEKLAQEQRARYKA